MDLSNYYRHDQLKAEKETFKKIFFYRICGTGMGAAACILKEKGYEVAGVDAKYAPPMSTYLEETGIPLLKMEDFSFEMLKDYDLIVVGNVVPRNSDDARSIEASGVPFTSFPSALGAFVLGSISNVVGLSGTHGKTTTTYFCVQLFEKLGLDPGYFIGGVIPGKPSSKLGGGKYFFIESDEYDSAYFEKISKFHSYFIDHLVITSLEFDHADIFSSIEDIKNQFRKLIPQVTSSFLINSDYPEALSLFEVYKDQADKDLNFYGSMSELGPKKIEVKEGLTTFNLRLDGKDEVFTTKVIGKYNIFNLSVAIFYAHKQGAKIEDIRRAAREMEMVKRRQEERGYYNKTLVVDDFAHHPTAVKLTLEALKQKYPNKPLHVILEPNSATARSSLFQKEFGDSLCVDLASLVIAQPVNSTTAMGLQDLDCQKLAHYVNEQTGLAATVVTELDSLRKKLKEISQNEGILAVLSNGTCLGLWSSDFVNEIK